MSSSFVLSLAGTALDAKQFIAALDKRASCRRDFVLLGVDLPLDTKTSRPYGSAPCIHGLHSTGIGEIQYKNLMSSTNQSGQMRPFKSRPRVNSCQKDVPPDRERCLQKPIGKYRELEMSPWTLILDYALHPTFKSADNGVNE
ncbi:uncharacterized protein FOMMEDRAFT_150307 [Fomitiporia mediterranea MF3/22]|uniref:uncharacterized protein n=1 Tax=Fomitiporia mediterranea (strain MF3/22) TaxID=694068 RepID=UPI0004408D96|nr:uncharacterized protein FOMMEDRAFT_150307 [Fomitiporia mediterranea MF3/22]EJD07764.1 hypothetical protein FOMMEDRAFT_150307 [Fomitiporia mediterranea MF3/22]